MFRLVCVPFFDSHLIISDSLVQYRGNINNNQHEKKQESIHSLDVLFGEIKRLRRMKKESGRLSRSNERKLKSYKVRFRELLEATVIYPEDRLHIPAKVHVQLASEMGRINYRLKEALGEAYDSRMLGLMFDIFEFEVSRGTILRNYYLSEEERK